MLVYGETVVKFQARTWKSAAGAQQSASPILPGRGPHSEHRGPLEELVDEADSWASPTEILVLETQAGARW